MPAWWIGATTSLCLSVETFLHGLYKQCLPAHLHEYDSRQAKGMQVSKSNERKA